MKRVWRSPFIVLLLTLAATSAAAKPAAKPRNNPDSTDPAARPQGKGGRSGKGVRQLFEDAQKLYDSGKFQEALRAFDAIVRKYPGHEPAQLQLAKTLYRLDLFKEAYVIFSHIDPQHLDPETSYEYAWSFYQNKQWDGALYSFQRVPKGHALFDLANYYGAICAIKLKKFPEASEMLEKAVVLPDKLAKSRTLYIKHVHALMLMQQKSALAREREAESERLAEPKKTKKDKAQEKTAATNTAAPLPTEYVHKGKKGIARVAEVSHTLQHQYRENHGYRTSDFDAKITTLAVASGFITPLPIKQSKDRSAAVGAQVDLAGSDIIKSGRESRFIIDEDDSDLSRVQSQDIAEHEIQFGSVGGQLWIEFPLPVDAWLALGSEIAFEYPEFKRGGRYGYRRGYGQLAGNSTPIDFTTELSYSELLDEKTQPTTKIIGGRAAAESAILGSLILRAALDHKLYSYQPVEPALDGPDTETHAELWAKQNFLYGFSFSLALDFARQQNYIHNNIPTYGRTAADGQTISGKAVLRANPLSWLGMSLAQSIAKTEWQLANELAKEPFEITVPNYIEDFRAEVTISLVF